MAEFVANVPIKFTTTSVTVAASPVSYGTANHPFPLTVTAIPGGGGTMNVEYRTAPGSSTWIAWPSGAVGAATADTLMSPVYELRFTAAGATGSVEVAG